PRDIYRGTALAGVVGERVAVDQDVGNRGPADELVGVDAGAADRAGLVVVPEQVVLDDGLAGGAVVGQADAGDVVLEDVVEDVRPRSAGAQVDAVTGEGLVSGILDGEAVDGHAAGGDGNALGVVQDRLGGAGAAVLRVHPVLGAEQGDRLVDRDRHAGV